MNVGDRVRVVDAEVAHLIGLECVVVDTDGGGWGYIEVQADTGRYYRFYPHELEVL